MKKIYSLLFTLFFSTFLIGQNNILIIDYNNAFTSDQNNNASRIYNRLLATQASVTRIGSIPATISNATYNQVWLFGNMGAPVAGNLNPIINFMNGGGGVYVQSEVSCCNTQANYLDALINATVITGGSITHNTTYSNPYQFTPNPNTVCSSSGNWSHYGNAVRPFIGVAAQNILFQITTTCSNLGVNNAGVQFRSCDLISGRGALIGTGDINLFALNANCGGNSALNGNPNNNIVIDHIANLFPALRNCSFGTSTGSATWTNPSPICAAAGSINLNSLVTGTAGGTWSGTGVSGSTFNPASGTQSVTYTVGTSPCTQSQTHTITVRPDVNPAWNNPSPICAAAGSINLNSLITGTAGGTWSGTGVSGSSFNPSSGSQSVTYTVGTAPCQETSTQTITVRPDVNPAWTNPGPLCAANGGTVTLVSAQSGGSWSGTGVTSGGVFSLSAGTQSITYTIGTAPCQETSTQTITVIPDVNPAWNNPSPICAAAGSINLSSLVTGTTGGTWSGTGVSGSTFNPASGTQSVTYTVGTAPCQETSTQTITVIPDVNPAWNNPSPICAAAGSINLSSLVTGTTGGTWSGTGVSGSSFNPASGTQSVTYTVGTAPCVETQTHTITVIPDVNPSWTNPSPICAASGPINLNSLITGTTGGSWSGTGVSGSSFNPASGTQSVTYTVGTAPCQETSTQTITVATVSAAWTNPSPICEGDAPINLSTLVTGSAGGSFSGTGVTANTLDPSGMGGASVSITYTVGTAPCTETQTHTIVINNDDDASFSYPQSSYCITGNNPTPTVTGTSGGTFTISAPGSINATTGEINLIASGTGSFTVTYNTATAGNPCPVTASTTITITTGQTAGFSYDNAQYCVYDNAPILTLNGGATAGTFSASPTGLTIDNAGAVTLSTSTPGIYTVYNNVPAANGCAPAIDSTTIEILPLDTATFSYSANAYCLADPNPTATVTGTPGGTFSISPTSGVINTSTGEIDIYASGAGTYVIYYNTASAGNPCPVTDSVTITLMPQNFIVPNSIPNFCLGDSTALTATASGNGTITWYSDVAGTTVIGTGSPFFPPITAAGTYTYYVNEAGTCPSPMDSVTFTVQYVDAQASASPSVGPMPLVVNFSNSSTGATNYFWDFANGNLDSTFAPTQTYSEPGTYTVTLVVTDGLCWDSTTIVIEVFNESSLTIPNVFTPNGDGHNDVFTVDGENLKSVEGEIYNRWGQKMFAWGNVNGYWDGKTLAGADAPDGTYFFIIKAEGIDGQQFFEKGTLSLIR